MENNQLNNPELFLTGRSKDINNIGIKIFFWGDDKAKPTDPLQYILPFSSLLNHSKNS